MMFREWPFDISCPVTTSWFLENTSLSSGRGLDGREQIVFRENRRWVGSLTVPKIWKKDIPRWYAFVDSLRGRAVPFCVPVCNPYAPRAGANFLSSIGIEPASVSEGCLPFSDEMHFSDDTCFHFPEYEDVTVGGAGSSAGSSSLTISGSLTQYLCPGVYFSIGKFLYRIERREGFQLHFNPPLRANVAAGDVIEIEEPQVMVRLASDSDARLVQTAGRRGQALSFNVVEVFQR